EDDRDRNMLRRIHSSEIVREPETEEIAYVVRGQSFLRYMVRKMVGTLLEVGKEGWPPRTSQNCSSCATVRAPAPPCRPKGYTSSRSNFPTRPIRSRRPPRAGARCIPSARIHVNLGQ